MKLRLTKKLCQIFWATLYVLGSLGSPVVMLCSRVVGGVGGA